MLRSLLLTMTLAALATPAGAGSLTPAGAPAPTMKSLDQVEPRIPIGPLTTPGDANSTYRISVSGSYYLTGNLLGSSGKHGIEIIANGVTVDLMGFTVWGGGGSLSGVSATVSGLSGVTVANGVVRAWGQHGVDLSLVTGSTVRNCAAIENGDTGIRGGQQGLVESCTASGNAVNGITTSAYSVLRNAVCADNGFDGIQIGSFGSCFDSTANDNGGKGIAAGSGVVIRNCSATSNGTVGISAGGHGVLSGCMASFNGTTGIDIEHGANISGCTVYANTGDGIYATSNNLIIDNKCVSAGNGGSGAGIHISGSGNTISGNAVNNSDIGIDVDVAGNFIVCNTARGNTLNYSIVANNKVGAIVSSPNSAAISGATGGSGVGSTDPWANFSY